jgi:hypothetical protein
LGPRRARRSDARPADVVAIERALGMNDTV